MAAVSTAVTGGAACAEITACTVAQRFFRTSAFDGRFAVEPRNQLELASDHDGLEPFGRKVDSFHFADDHALAVFERLVRER